MLKNTVEFPIKFSEVDSLRVVWHGHYVRYFEDGREAFGKQYNLGYLDIYEHGLAVPLIDLQVNFKRILEYGDSVRVETSYIETPAAKLIFEYKLISVNKELYITVPPFMEVWKKKWGITS
jgi:acyl-CoA thioester hydrolase